MNKQAALEITNHILIIAQKMKSNVAEMFDGIEESNLANMVFRDGNKWNGGYNGRKESHIINQALHLLDVEFTPMGFYNLLTMVAHDETIAFTYRVWYKEDVPEPTFDVLKDLRNE